MFLKFTCDIDERFDLINTKTSNCELRLMFRRWKDGKHSELEKDFCYVHEIQNEVVEESLKKTGTCFTDWLAAATDDAAERSSSTQAMTTVIFKGEFDCITWSNNSPFKVRNVKRLIRLVIKYGTLIFSSAVFYF